LILIQSQPEDGSRSEIKWIKRVDTMDIQPLDISGLMDSIVPCQCTQGCETPDNEGS